ncbi:hypothetical protein IT774_04295 [Salinimonas marina]|uniref:Right handed beta helix domain-containing protein n=1 Tax=Salinimonas marina TaxID=2785918 RepID=A0A7S9DYR1_9ALTE|nr:hypothetical protein [Salinimonas marina]QPG06419.1 hypothetical protein IT774_04295 [Salinimonas marina]
MQYINRIIATVLAILIFHPSFAAESSKNGWTYEAKMPMHVVYPRPDCETREVARHRWAHTDMTYRIPIGVQGGAWPFTYKLIEGPEGAVIGQTETEDNYGIVSWDPGTASPSEVTFRVRVKDKVGNNTDITWSVRVDNDKFLFIQDGYDGPKVGSINQPLEDIADWYKGDRDNADYHNRIVVFRDGNYQLIGGEDTKFNVRLNADTKTPSLIGFPGEKAVIDASKAKVLTENDRMTDLFIADLHWKDSRQDVNNAHFFWAVGNVTRATWWNNSFSNHGMGKKGNDNPAGVFISDRSHHKKNILYKDNKHDGFMNGRGNGSYVDIYYSSYVLIEGNYASNSDNACGFWAKGTTSFVTIRDNHAYDNIGSGGICVGYGRESPEIPHDHEIAWNRIVIKEGNKRGTALRFSGQKSWDGKHYNSYIYRNTFINGSAWVRFEGKNKYFVDGNVVVNNNPRHWDTRLMKTYQNNMTGTQSDYIVDKNGDLTGFARESKGQVGYQR